MLAERAARSIPAPRAEAALRVALAASNVRARYALTSKAGGDVVWSPNGTRLLMTSPGVRPDAWARIYTPGSSAAPVSMPGPSIRGASGWDANGRSCRHRRRPAGGLRRPHRPRHPPVPGPGVARGAHPERQPGRDHRRPGRRPCVSTWRPVARSSAFHPHYTAGANCFALSPNGRYVAQCDAPSFTGSSAPAALDVWSTTTGQLVRSVPTPTLIGSVAFSPDGTRFVYTITSPVLSAAASLATKTKATGVPGTFVYDTVGHGGPVITFPGGATAAVFGPSVKYPTIVYATLSDHIAHVYQFASGRNIPLTGAGGRDRHAARRRQRRLRAHRWTGRRHPDLRLEQRRHAAGDAGRPRRASDRRELRRRRRVRGVKLR